MTTRRVALDAVLVLCLGAATYVTSRHAFQLAALGADKPGGPSAGQMDLAVWWAATVGGLVALLLRHRFPLAALAGTVVMAYLHLVDWPIGMTPLDLAAPICLYTVAAAPRSLWVSYAALAGSIAVALLPKVLGNMPIYYGPWRGVSLLPAVVMTVAWLAGDRERSRRLYLDQVTERAADLERERDQQAELAAAAERARIARDLHDSVAHGLSIVVIQAQAAAGAMERRPATAHAALASIVATGRDSLTDMRRLLGLSRPEEPELAPLPGLRDVPVLVERVRAAGLETTLHLDAETAVIPPNVPASVGVSAYRIVQEALTNVLKHAGPHATAEVVIRTADDEVELTIRDLGSGTGGAPDERRGNGLRGMRERVAASGGCITASDADGGGFQVHATLPCPVRQPA